MVSRDSNGVYVGNRDAERALIGAMIRGGRDTVARILPIAGTADFTADHHRRVFVALTEMYYANEPIDAVTLFEAIHRSGQSGDVSAAHIGELLDGGGTPAQAEHYAKIVTNHARARLAIDIGNRLVRGAVDGADVDELLNSVQAEVTCLKTGPTKNATGWRWDPVDAATAQASDYRPAFLIRRLLVANQPGFVIGGSKTLKTTIAMDAALSLATGGNVLGEFAVPSPRRVAFLSGESGEYTILETRDRIMAARGMVLSPGQLILQFRLPQLAMADEIDDLKRGLQDSGIEVVFFDPLYLSLLSGSQGIDASNMYQMGPLLRRITDACLEVGATPQFLHHANRPGSRKLEPLELSDIAYSGVPEFARQWWLLSRREAFVPGSGQHRLFLSAGGSIGHGGLWHVDINEGKLGDDFSGRIWDVQVSTATEGKTAAKADKQAGKAVEMQADESAVMVIVDRLAAEGDVCTLTRLRNGCGLSRSRTDQAIERLRQAKIIECDKTDIEAGHGAKQKAMMIRRKKGTVCDGV